MGLKTKLSLERAVFCLIPELQDPRQEFIKILNLLDDIEAYREIIVNAGSQAENLIERVEDSSSVRTKDISLINRIDSLMNKGILPAEIASYFHTIRVFSNKARHGAEKIGFNMRDIENILGILLRIFGMDSLLVATRFHNQLIASSMGSRIFRIN